MDNLPRIIASLITEDPDLIVEAKCPKCNDSNAYVGFNKVECTNNKCTNFNQKQADEINKKAKPTNGAFIRIFNLLNNYCGTPYLDNNQGLGISIKNHNINQTISIIDELAQKETNKWNNSTQKHGKPDPTRPPNDIEDIKFLDGPAYSNIPPLPTKSDITIFSNWVCNLQSPILLKFLEILINTATFKMYRFAISII